MVVIAGAAAAALGAAAVGVEWSVRKKCRGAAPERQEGKSRCGEGSRLGGQRRWCRSEAKHNQEAKKGSKRGKGAQGQSCARVVDMSSRRGARAARVVRTWRMSRR